MTDLEMYARLVVALDAAIIKRAAYRELRMLRREVLERLAAEEDKVYGPELDSRGS